NAVWRALSARQQACSASWTRIRNIYLAHLVHRSDECLNFFPAGCVECWEHCTSKRGGDERAPGADREYFACVLDAAILGSYPSLLYLWRVRTLGTGDATRQTLCSPVHISCTQPATQNSYGTAIPVRANERYYP